MPRCSFQPECVIGVQCNDFTVISEIKFRGFCPKHTGMCKLHFHWPLTFNTIYFKLYKKLNKSYHYFPVAPWICRICSWIVGRTDGLSLPLLYVNRSTTTFIRKKRINRVFPNRDKVKNVSLTQGLKTYQPCWVQHHYITVHLDHLHIWKNSGFWK